MKKKAYRATINGIGASLLIYASNEKCPSENRMKNYKITEEFT